MHTGGARSAKGKQRHAAEIRDKPEILYGLVIEQTRIRTLVSSSIHSWPFFCY